MIGSEASNFIACTYFTHQTTAQKKKTNKSVKTIAMALCASELIYVGPTKLKKVQQQRADISCAVTKQCAVT